MGIRGLDQFVRNLGVFTKFKSLTAEAAIALGKGDGQQPLTVFVDASGLVWRLFHEFSHGGCELEYGCASYEHFAASCEMFFRMMLECGENIHIVAGSSNFRLIISLGIFILLYHSS